jgi:signal transduction histidine kinase/ligand-binding sensor domain-containing protein
MTSKGLLFLSAALLALAQRSWGQKPFNWRVYKTADGLPESSCLSVAISPQGKVLVRHFDAPLVSELDGYSISTLPAPEGRSRVYESPGGQLWTVVSEGLQEFRDGSWMLHPITEFATQPRVGGSSMVNPTPLCPVRQGVVILLLPERVWEFNLENLDHPRLLVLRLAEQTHLEHFSSMGIARDGGLWISGTRGLAKVPAPLRNLKSTTEWQEFLLPSALAIQNLQEPHEDDAGGVTMMGEFTTNQQRAIVCFDGHQWSAWPAGNEKLRQAWRGPEQSFWGMGTLALLESEGPEPDLSESDEISARQYYDVATEPGGAFWLATSEGLARFAPLTWRTPALLRQLRSPVHGLVADSVGRVWFVSGNALHLFQNGQAQEFPFPAALARTLQATRSLFALKSGVIALEGEEQLFRFESANGRFFRVSGNPAGKALKVVGILKDGRLCIQTREPESTDTRCRLAAYDGANFEALPDPPEDASLGANLYTCFTAQNGDWWLGAEHGTACYRENKWRTFTSTDRTAPESVWSFVELADGRIWCATRDQIWEFDGRSWSVVRGGFDGISGLLRTRKGAVWVASNSGLHRFFQGPLVEKGAWVENGPEEGLPSAVVREICEDQEGNVWAGTAHGLSLFHPEADADPPQTLIQRPADHENRVPEGGTITLAFRGRDKWNYTPAGRLLYSYSLDGGDWSAFQDVGQVSFSELHAGTHYFQVRAMDRNCNVEVKPPRHEFLVIMPWYRELRLVLIACAGLGSAFFLAALAFNRHRRLVRSYAEVERIVGERTRQLEAANRELFHSQKMNALGTLAAGIAHDFNNILSIIKGSAQIIEDNLDNPEKIRTRADRIKTVVEQGAGMVRAMLGFSRESAPEPTLCDVNAVVGETLKLLGDRFLREVQVNFLAASGLPEVLAPKDFIQQILLNIIFNAAESMARDKHIVLKTGTLEGLPGGLALGPAPATTCVLISVQDFGCGIPAENLPRIFEPFFTTKALSTRRGTGLGLSMVYELAKKMGAGLAVKSVVNQGSTFTLLIPVRPSPAKS